MLRKAVVPVLGLSMVLFVAAPIIIHRAPYEATMGLVQKIFYFHVPAAILMLLLAITCGVLSAVFLFGKKQAADWWALATAELVVLFGSMAMVTGPLWGRKAWGVWWEWEPRLTSSLMLYMIFVAYLLLRRFGGPGAEKLAAGMALFGMANVPFVYISVNVWRTLHPKTTVIPNLVPPMAWPLWLCFTAFLLLALALLAMRVQLEEQRARVESLYLAAEED
ncbi:MAG: cytochrome c biogenesis protein CcsA [Acidobacteriota bacterium]